MITLETIRDAACRIRHVVRKTPVLTSDIINRAVDAEVFFKCENLQFEGAFKSRGACNAVFALDDESAAKGVVTHSSGNHAAALARAAALRGITAHIVMPENSARTKIDAVRRLGIEPVFCKPDTDSRQAAAERVMQSTGATFVHPYDNEAVIAGQGTAVLELLSQVTSLDSVIVPVGGGGLLSGTLIGCHAMQPGLRVFGAEPEWADDAVRSLKAGTLQSPTRYDSIADGLRTRLGDLTFPIIQKHVTDILLTSEEAIRAATVGICRNLRIIAEPSGAVPLAALSIHRERFHGQKVGVIVSGGNIDTALLCRLLSSET